VCDAENNGRVSPHRGREESLDITSLSIRLDALMKAGDTFPRQFNSASHTFPRHGRGSSRRMGLYPTALQCRGKQPGVGSCGRWDCNYVSGSERGSVPFELKWFGFARSGNDLHCDVGGRDLVDCVTE
jgi:hypothetical protein